MSKFTPQGGVVGRRAIVAGAAMVAGCSVLGDRGAAAKSGRSFADAHTHLFNAADLPAVKFVEYVVIPERAPGAPAWASALVDLFISVVKAMAITAATEDAFRPSLFRSQDAGASPDRFGERVAQRVDQVVGSRSAGLDGSTALADSYRLLTALVAEDGGAGLAARSARGFGGDPARVDPSVAKDAFSLLAKKAAGQDAAKPGDVLVRSRAGDNRGFVAEAVRMVGWAYLMCQSRRTHLARYIKSMGASGERPALLINHMVDYDRWLGDGPAAGSDMFRQITLMAKIAREASSKLELTTFAGFCPLKHAMELRANQAPTTLQRLQESFSKGDIHGFKLYPPMGFQPIDNAGHPDSWFTSATGVGNSALDRWRAVASEPLGPALDQSLRQFYRWCAQNNAPLMAHAGPGNQAGWQFGQRANPIWWEKVVREFPDLSVSLGHLVDDAQDFIDAEHETPPPPKVWALDASIRMLGEGSGRTGRVYGDLAYMPELVASPALAKTFFKALKAKFGAADPGLRHILYGTDWVMLGLEKQYDHYLAALTQGMTDAGYSSDEVANITWRNARRFLRMDDPGKT